MSRPRIRIPNPKQQAQEPSPTAQSHTRHNICLSPLTQTHLESMGTSYLTTQPSSLWSFFVIVLLEDIFFYIYIYFGTHIVFSFAACTFLCFWVEWTSILGIQKALQKDPNFFFSIVFSKEYFTCNFDSVHNGFPSFFHEIR